jgi:hypothetical protein
VRRALPVVARLSAARDNCHGSGVAPTFHVGQRNDGPTCSFCHAEPHASAWSAGSYFIHAVHAGRVRGGVRLARNGARPRLRRINSRPGSTIVRPPAEHVRLHGVGVGQCLPNWTVTTVGTAPTRHRDERVHRSLRGARHGLRLRILVQRPPERRPKLRRRRW